MQFTDTAALFTPNLKVEPNCFVLKIGNLVKIQHIEFFFYRWVLKQVERIGESRRSQEAEGGGYFSDGPLGFWAYGAPTTETGSGGWARDRARARERRAPSGRIMALNEALCWYQRKIGAYDKQIWEETVEQRILHGLLTHVPKKSAAGSASSKLKLDYIDLDLVRGSSFPKLKPKHGLVTIARLGLLRLVFLPWYRSWWIRQTSYGIFHLLLVLYGFQIFNMTTYFSWAFSSSSTIGWSLTNSSSDSNATADHSVEAVPNELTSEEVLVPGLMMCMLSLLLSQMVSTHVNCSRPMRRPKNRIRIKRTKRRISRRISMAATDSKSSLENLEQTSTAPSLAEGSGISSGVASGNLETGDPPVQVKKRSNSEERPPSRVKVTQRSASLQLDPSIQAPIPAAGSAPAKRKSSWFFAWPVRLVVPKRTPNEDEGFDSFHGNNSSSSDCDNEVDLRAAASVVQESSEGPTATDAVDSTASATIEITSPAEAVPESLEHIQAVVEPRDPEVSKMAGSRLQEIKGGSFPFPLFSSSDICRVKASYCGSCITTLDISVAM